MNLTSRTKVKRHIGIPSSNTSKDALIDQIIEGVSGFIETQTHRTFEVKEYTEIFDGDGSDEIFLKQYPLRSVISLTINKSVIDLDAEEDAETIVIDNDAGSIYRQAGFAAGRKNIKVVYEAGFNAPDDPADSGSEESGETGEDLPTALEAAAIRLSARVYERRTAEGVSNVAPTGISIAYKDAIDADITSILEAYTKRRV